MQCLCQDDTDTALLKSSIYYEIASRGFGIICIEHGINCYVTTARASQIPSGSLYVPAQMNERRSEAEVLAFARQLRKWCKQAIRKNFPPKESPYKPERMIMNG